MKKCGRFTTQLREAREAATALERDDHASLEDLERCPDVVRIEAQAEAMRSRMLALNALNDGLLKVKTKTNAAFPGLVAAAILLGIEDTPPPKQTRGPSKPKGAPSSPRMPYFTYTSADGTDIRVGRRSDDNDELSCNPAHRDSADWWMHAAGCPGSHVVIRCTAPEVPRETLLDAAALAVVNSKAAQSGKSSVSLVRCRQVSKPMGSKAGLVQLSGGVKSVTVSVKNEIERLKRLDATKR
mmetsp:Transcript_22668/g.36482  ORF Transcript_22668/g.36482 Transcript_22668/m.36482 type:complete len:241 (-) Transcript_22668:110-832(-)